MSDLLSSSKPIKQRDAASDTPMSAAPAASACPSGTRMATSAAVAQAMRTPRLSKKLGDDRRGVESNKPCEQAWHSSVAGTGNIQIANYAHSRTKAKTPAPAGIAVRAGQQRRRNKVFHRKSAGQRGMYRGFSDKPRRSTRTDLHHRSSSENWNLFQRSKAGDLMNWHRIVDGELLDELVGVSGRSS